MGQKVGSFSTRFLVDTFKPSGSYIWPFELKVGATSRPPPIPYSRPTERVRDGVSGQPSLFLPNALSRESCKPKRPAEHVGLAGGFRGVRALPRAAQRPRTSALLSPRSRPARCTRVATETAHQSQGSRHEVAHSRRRDFATKILRILLFRMANQGGSDPQSHHF